MYEHVNTSCKHIPPGEQPLQFQFGYYLNKPRTWPVLLAQLFSRLKSHAFLRAFPVGT